MKDRITELRELIAEKEVVISPLRSELSKLQWELRKLENEQCGVKKGTRIVSDDGSEWLVTKVKNRGTTDEPQIHMQGHAVLQNGELSKKVRYIGILGFHLRVKEEVVAN